MSVVAVEFDLHDGVNPLTVRLWNGRAGGRALTRIVAGAAVQYEPGLITPFVLGASISPLTYGQAERGALEAGAIDFALGERFWPWLGYHWKGRTFRVYEGEAPVFAELSLIYTGRVADLTFDLATPRVSVKTTSAALDLDAPFVAELYPDDAPAALRGRPRPYLRGEVYSVEPVLEDDPTLTYRLSWGWPLSAVLALRVGGVAWSEVAGTPGGGEFAVDLAAGTLVLGSPSLGKQVLCDVRAVGWETCTSAALFSEIVTAAAGAIDSVALAAFAAAVPGRIGLYTGADAVNRLDILDAIAVGAGAFWEFDALERFRVMAIAAPVSPTLALTGVTVARMQLTGLMAPARRIRTEYRRNWNPLTTPEPFVTDGDAKAMGAGGIVAAPYEDAGIVAVEPRAIDAPLIRTLFVEEADTLEVRDRLAAAEGVLRHTYDAAAWVPPPALYDTLSLDYGPVAGDFRVLSNKRSVGGAGPSTMQLWG